MAEDDTRDDEQIEPTEDDFSGVGAVGDEASRSVDPVNDLTSGLGNVKARLEEIQQIAPQAFGQSFNSTMEKATQTSANVYAGFSRGASNAKDSNDKVASAIDKSISNIVNKFSGVNIFEDIGSGGGALKSAFDELVGLADDAMGGVGKILSGNSGRISSAIKKSIEPGAALFGQTIITNGLKAIDGATKIFSEFQKPIMQVEKQALQLSRSMGKSFSDSAGNVAAFRDTMVGAIADTKSDIEEVTKVQEEFKGAFDAGEVGMQLTDLSKASSQLTADVNLTNSALLVSAATGMESAKVAKMMSTAYLEFGGGIKESATMLGDIALASEKSGLGFEKIAASAMAATDKMKFFGGSVNAVTPLYEKFAKSLGEGQKGLAPELVEQFVGGLSSMGFEMKALIGMTGGIGGAGGGMGGAGPGGALGAGLEMEALMEKGPEGMAEMSDKLIATLSKVSGGQGIITREQAIKDPELVNQFMVQRTLLKQMTGASDAQANKLLGGLKEINESGMGINEDTQSVFGDLLATGERTQDRTVSELEKQTRYLQAMTQSAGIDLLENISNATSSLGKNIPSALKKAQVRAVKEGKITASNIAKTSREITGKKNVEAVKQSIGAGKGGRKETKQVQAGLKEAQSFEKNIMGGLNSTLKQMQKDILTGASDKGKDLTTEQRKDLQKGNLDTSLVARSIENTLVKVYAEQNRILAGRKIGDLTTKEKAQYVGTEQLVQRLQKIKGTDQINIGRQKLTKKEQQQKQQEDTRVKREEAQESGKDLAKSFDYMIKRMNIAEKSGVRFDLNKATAAEKDVTEKMKELRAGVKSGAIDKKQLAGIRQSLGESYADKGEEVQQTMLKAFDRMMKFETVTGAFAGAKLDDLDRTPQVEEPTIQYLPEKEEEAQKALAQTMDEGTRATEKATRADVEKAKRDIDTDEGASAIVDSLNEQTARLEAASKETKDAVNASGERTKGAMEKASDTDFDSAFNQIKDKFNEIDVESLKESGVITTTTSPEGISYVENMLKEIEDRFGGEIVTREDAIANPELQEKFLQQRETMKETMGDVGVSLDDAEATKMLSNMKEGVSAARSKLKEAKALQEQQLPEHGDTGLPAIREEDLQTAPVARAAVEAEQSQVGAVPAVGGKNIAEMAEEQQPTNVISARNIMAAKEQMAGETLAEPPIDMPETETIDLPDIPDREITPMPVARAVELPDMPNEVVRAAEARPKPAPAPEVEAKLPEMPDVEVEAAPIDLPEPQPTRIARTTAGLPNIPDEAIEAADTTTVADEVVEPKPKQTKEEALAIMRGQRGERADRTRGAMEEFETDMGGDDDFARPTDKTPAVKAPITQDKGLPDIPAETAETVDTAPIPDEVVTPKPRQTAEEARNIMSGRTGEKAERIASEQAAFEADMGDMFVDREPVATKPAAKEKPTDDIVSGPGWGATDVTDELKRVGGGQIVSQEEAAGNEELQKVFDAQTQLLKEMTGTDDKGAADLMSSLKDISESGEESQNRLSETMETASKDDQERRKAEDPVEQARQVVDRATTEQPALAAPVDQATQQAQEVREKRTMEEKETVERRKLMLDVELNTKVDGQIVTIVVDKEKLEASIREYINEQNK